MNTVPPLQGLLDDPRYGELQPDQKVEALRAWEKDEIERRNTSGEWDLDSRANFEVETRRARQAALGIEPQSPEEILKGVIEDENDPEAAQVWEALDEVQAAERDKREINRRRVLPWNREDDDAAKLEAIDGRIVAAKSGVAENEIEQARLGAEALQGKRDAAVVRGKIVLNPELYYDRERYVAAVNSASATPREKARALAGFYRGREETAKAALPKLRGVGAFRSFADTYATENPEATNGDVVEAFRKSGAGDLDKWYESISSGFLSAMEGVGYLGFAAGALQKKLGDAADAVGLESFGAVNRASGNTMQDAMLAGLAETNAAKEFSADRVQTLGGATTAQQYGQVGGQLFGQVALTMLSGPMSSLGKGAATAATKKALAAEVGKKLGVGGLAKKWGKEAIQTMFSPAGVLAGASSAGPALYESYERNRTKLAAEGLTGPELEEAARGEAFVDATRSALITSTITSLFGLRGVEGVGRLTQVAGNPAAREVIKKTVKERWADVGLGTLSEGVEEALDEGINGGLDALLENPDMTFEDWQKATLFAGSAGALFGGGIEGITSVAEAAAERVKNSPEMAARQQTVQSLRASGLNQTADALEQANVVAESDAVAAAIDEVEARAVGAVERLDAIDTELVDLAKTPGTETRMAELEAERDSLNQALMIGRDAMRNYDPVKTANIAVADVVAEGVEPEEARRRVTEVMNTRYRGKPVTPQILAAQALTAPAPTDTQQTDEEGILQTEANAQTVAPDETSEVLTSTAPVSPVTPVKAEPTFRAIAGRPAIVDNETGDIRIDEDGTVLLDRGPSAPPIIVSRDPDAVLSTSEFSVTLDEETEADVEQARVLRTTIGGRPTPRPIERPAPASTFVRDDGSIVTSFSGERGPVAAVTDFVSEGETEAGDLFVTVKDRETGSEFELHGDDALAVAVARRDSARDPELTEAVTASLPEPALDFDRVLVRMIGPKANLLAVVDRIGTERIVSQQRLDAALDELTTLNTEIENENFPEDIRTRLLGVVDDAFNDLATVRARVRQRPEAPADRGTPTPATPPTGGTEAVVDPAPAESAATSVTDEPEATPETPAPVVDAVDINKPVTGETTGKVPRASQALVTSLNQMGVSVHFTTSSELAALTAEHGAPVDINAGKSAGSTRSGLFTDRSGTPRIYVLTDNSNNVQKTLLHEARHAANSMGKKANPEAHAAAVAALQNSPDLLKAAAKKYPGFAKLSPDRQLSEVLSMMADGKLDSRTIPSEIMRFVEAILAALRGSVLVSEVSEINGYFADLSALLAANPVPATPTLDTETARIALEATANNPAARAEIVGALTPDPPGMTQSAPTSEKPLSDEAAEMIRDIIAMRKSQGQAIDPNMVARLARYDAAKQGVEIPAGGVVSQIVVGHPLFESPHAELNYLLPLQAFSYAALDRKWVIANRLREGTQTFVAQGNMAHGKAKTAAQKKKAEKEFPRSEISRKQEVLDYMASDTFPEFDRMFRLLPAPQDEGLPNDQGGENPRETGLATNAPNIVPGASATPRVLQGAETEMPRLREETGAGSENTAGGTNPAPLADDVVETAMAATEGNPEARAELMAALTPEQRAAYGEAPEGTIAIQGKFLEIKDPVDNVTQVAQSNGKDAGAKIEMRPADSLTGILRLDQPEERARVDSLKAWMLSEEGALPRILVDKEGNVIEGQHRFAALRELGATEVPVVTLYETEDFVPDVPALDAVLKPLGLHRDQRNQLISSIGEILLDENGDANELLNYDAPAGFETQWDAAVQEVLRQMGAAPTPSPAADITTDDFPVDPVPLDASPVGPRPQFNTLTPQQQVNLARNIAEFGWAPEEFGATKEEIDATLRENPRRVFEEKPANRDAPANAAPAFEIVRTKEMENLPDDDGYFYHVTTKENAAQIVETQELSSAGGQTMDDGFYRQYSAGKVFLTDAGGVGYWMGRISDHLEAQGRKGRVVVLRVPKRNISNTQVDELGTTDSRQPAWYVEGSVRPVGPRTSLADMAPDGVLYRAGSRTPPNTLGAVFYSGDRAYIENYLSDDREVLVAPLPTDVVDVRTPEGVQEIFAWAKQKAASMAESENFRAARAARDASSWLQKGASTRNVSVAMANLTMGMGYEKGIPLNPGLAEKQFLEDTNHEAITVWESVSEHTGKPGDFSVAFRDNPSEVSLEAAPSNSFTEDSDWQDVTNVLLDRAIAKYPKIPVTKDSNIPAPARTLGLRILVNPEELARYTEGMEVADAAEMIEKIFLHEATHRHAVAEVGDNTVVEYANTMTVDERTDVAFAYLHRSAYPSDEAYLKAVNDFAAVDPNLSPGDRRVRLYRLGHEALRMNVERLTSGYTTEETLAFLQTNPGNLQRFIRYLGAYLRRLKQWFKSRKDPVIGVEVRRLGRVIDTLTKGETVSRGPVNFDPDAKGSGRQIIGLAAGPVKQNLWRLTDGRTEWITDGDPVPVASTLVRSQMIEENTSDAAYLAAVERGDMETAQRMVDEFADEQEFTESGVRSGFYVDGVPMLPSSSANLGTGYYAVLGGTLEDVSAYENAPIARDAKEAGATRMTGNVRIKLGKVLRLDHPSGAWDYIKRNGLERAFQAWLDLQGTINQAYSKFGGRPQTAGDRRGSGISIDKNGKGEAQDTGKAISYLFDTGKFDSVIVDWDAAAQKAMRAGDGRVGKEVAVANANQIKSADPVTYDEQGNIIPLSQRFNPESNSILETAPVGVWNKPKANTYVPGGGLTAAHRWDRRFYKMLEDARGEHSGYMKKAEFAVKQIARLMKDLNVSEAAVDAALGNTENRLTQADVDQIKAIKKRGLAAAQGVYLSARNKAKALDAAGMFADAALARQDAKAQFDLDVQTYQRAAANYEARARRAAAAKAYADRQAAMAALPKPLADEVANLRTEIDLLSDRMIAEGDLSAELKATISANKELWLHRSYQIFDDPNYVAWINEQKDPEAIRLRNKTINYLRQDLVTRKVGELMASGMSRTAATAQAQIDVTDDHVKDAFDDYLMVADNGSKTLLTGATVSKEVSALMKRGVIPEEIQELWGRYDDPAVNAAKSIGAIAQHLAIHKFYQDIIALGTKEGWLVKDGPGVLKRDAQGNRLYELLPNNGMAGRYGNKPKSQYAPLAGYLGPEALRDALAQMVDDRAGHRFIQFFTQLTGYSMASKTVLSHQSGVRNYHGGVLPTMINGNLGVFTARGRKRIAEGHRLAWNLRWLKGDKATRDTLVELTTLGVLGQGITENLIKDLTGGFDSDKKIVGLWGKVARAKLFGKGIEGTRKGALKVYEASGKNYNFPDEVWKIVNYLGELDKLRDILPNETEENLKKRAAEITRNTFQDYSRAPEWVKVLRKFPVMAPFITFPAEMVRITLGQGKVGLDFIREGKATGNRKMEAAGYYRLLTSGIVAGVVGSIPLVFKAMSDVSTDDEDDLRKHLAPWEKNVTILFLGRNEGDPSKINYLNLSFMNPYDIWLRPWRSFMRGMRDPNADGFGVTAEAAGELVDPIAKEQILFGSLVDTLRGVTATGRKVWDKTDSDLDKAIKSMTHVYNSALEPGTITSIEKIVKAANSEVSVSGRAFNVWQETISAGLGLKANTVDVNSTLAYAAKDFRGGRLDSISVFSRTFKSSGTQKDEDIIDAYVETNDKMLRTYRELYEKTVGAVRLGAMTRQEAIQLLRSEDVPADVIGDIMNNRYRRYTPSPDSLQDARRKGEKLGQDRINLYRQALDRVPAVQQISEDTFF